MSRALRGLGFASDPNVSSTIAAGTSANADDPAESRNLLSLAPNKGSENDPPGV